MRKLITILFLATTSVAVSQNRRIGDYIESLSYNDGRAGIERTMQYKPVGRAFVCHNGTNRFTRALYGSPTDWRLETSDRPVFAVAKKNHHRNIRLRVWDVALDSTDYCEASYADGVRSYELRDKRWGMSTLRLQVVAHPTEESAVFRFQSDNRPLDVQFLMCHIARPKLSRNGDIGADPPGVFESDPAQTALRVSTTMNTDHRAVEGYIVVCLDSVSSVSVVDAAQRFKYSVDYFRQLASRIEFCTPDPYINTLGGALVLAADGDWDGLTWLHGCVGWRMPLAGWRAAYAGDVLGWGDRAQKHFNAYAASQVTSQPAVMPHPTQDPKQQMARAEKRWGTQMYSDGYICRNPNRNNQMHHYDMNLNYVDELLWHFQYDADTTYMRKMWPLLKRHLAWEKRNYDPDGDHLYDAYCCIWASDALYYNGGAVTHSSAYNYRANRLAARIAQIIGEDGMAYQREADAILDAMNSRLWLTEKEHWAEYQDLMGLRRVHPSAAVWSIYTPIDCGACSAEQAYQATLYIDRCIPHIPVTHQYSTISTSSWMPYSWSINNVAAAEVMHTALAYYEAGRADAAFHLMKANILDQMYYGQSPANFGQISHYDAARGECYRDFGDCIGISSRTLVQGLFGIQPDALYGRCVIRPGFPQQWDSASIHTPYMDYRFERKGGIDRYEITQRFPQPLRIVLRQNLGHGRYLDVEGSADAHQVIEVPTVVPVADPKIAEEPLPTIYNASLAEPVKGAKYHPQKVGNYFNANITDIFHQQYISPRAPYTTLQIPLQGIGEWCHPHYCPDINDSVFRSKAHNDRFVVAGVPFVTPQKGRNVIYTSLWDNYPDAVIVPLSGRAQRAWLLMAGSTNHMQCYVDNAIIVVDYTDGSADTLALQPPYNWCPIEQEYYVDRQAFCTVEPRPYRIALGTGDVSRDLGSVLNIKGVYGREIPGGGAQMLSMPLDSRKKLRSLTLRTLSNDVVVGLMGVTLEK